MRLEPGKEREPVRTERERDTERGTFFVTFLVFLQQSECVFSVKRSPGVAVLSAIATPALAPMLRRYSSAIAPLARSLVIGIATPAPGGRGCCFAPRPFFLARSAIAAVVGFRVWCSPWSSRRGPQGFFV